MKPLVKYQGGKSKEIKHILPRLPKTINRVIEPFCGGAALSFYLQKPSLLNDTNWYIINLYQTVSSKKYYSSLYNFVDRVKTYDREQLERLYYRSRKVFNSNNRNWLESAKAYIVLRQLCFSGMERYNSDGLFNVPFGHYKRFSCNLSLDHHYFLNQKCVIKHDTFETSILTAREDDFLFIDPPYLDRAGYAKGDGGMALHERLRECLSQSKAQWMIIHSDHPFYRSRYSKNNIEEVDFRYSQIFGKDKNHSNAKVSHLYITNYGVSNEIF